MAFDVRDLGAMSRDALSDLLQWYSDFGVDLAVDERPHDRFAEAKVPSDAAGGSRPAPVDASAERQDPAEAAARSQGATSPLAPRRLVPSVAATLSADQAVQSAREAAASAATLADLRAALERFEGCGLKVTATRLVFADGNPDARIMLVGGAPDDEDDRDGRPFAGRAGRLLDRMLAAIGLDRTAVYVTNLLPWRPPGNRSPTPAETAVCLPFIRRHIELADLDLLVCMGDLPVNALLAQKEGVGRVRGQWLDYAVEGGRRGPRNLKAMPTLHPNHLLRAPLQKRLAWRDLQAIERVHEALRGTMLR